ncbi:hypothetical protein U8335_13750 [Roseiconus lacunae]|uniref:hypothetical protein n=1 Tax=Roseiconus lacunae TaxID=2605694 RepID=UPI00308FC117|nr:hypothetical protein U8335_13750 [Stieleria sp. HD01]
MIDHAAFTPTRPPPLTQGFSRERHAEDKRSDDLQACPCGVRRKGGKLRGSSIKHVENAIEMQANRLTQTAKPAIVKRMDPIEVLNQLLEALTEEDREGALAAAENLRTWIHQGGFAPLLRVTMDDRKSHLVADNLSREFCLAACRMADAMRAPRSGPELNS